jgi:hypothetical protein
MPTLSDPRESEDRLVNAIVASADSIMKLVEEVSLGSMTAKTLENARVLVALDRIRSSLTDGKTFKRKPTTEAKNKVGLRDPRSTATDDNEC